MPEIIAKRDTGLLEGPDVTEPLAASIAALQARGTYELDRGEESSLVDIEGWQPWVVNCCQLVRPVDMGYGAPFVGRITSIEYEDLGGGATTRLTLDVPQKAIDPNTLPVATTVDNGE